MSIWWQGSSGYYSESLTNDYSGCRVWMVIYINLHSSRICMKCLLLEVKQPTINQSQICIMHQQINFTGEKIGIITFSFNLTKKKIKLFLKHVKKIVPNYVNNKWTYHLFLLLFSIKIFAFWTISFYKKWHQFCFHLATQKNCWLFYRASQLEFYWANLFLWFYFYSSIF